jgi:hypothetical protein
MEGGIEALRAVGRLKFAGVPTQEGGQAVSLGMGLGYTGLEAARGIYAAGELSSLSPVEMAQMAQKGLPGWKGTQGGAPMGLAVAAQLSTIIKEPGRLGTFTERARSGILGPGREDFWEKIGGGDTFMSRMQALSRSGITTDVQLEKAGFTEKRERMSIGILVGRLSEIQDKHRKILTMMETPGLLLGIRRTAEEELPFMEYERKAGMLEAQFRGEEVLPTTATSRRRMKQAMGRNLKMRARAIAAKEFGMESVIDQEDLEEGKMDAIDWFQAQLLLSRPLLPGVVVTGKNRAAEMRSRALEIEKNLSLVEGGGETKSEVLLQQLNNKTPYKATQAPPEKE